VRVAGIAGAGKTDRTGHHLQDDAAAIQNAPAGSPHPMTRFVIVCHGRTGSTLLCSLLDSHPAVVCHREVFSQHVNAAARLDYAPGYVHRSSLPRRWLTATRDFAPGAFLDDLFADAVGHHAVGFKLLAQHVRHLRSRRPSFISALLADPDIHKLILRRENRVRVYVSKKRGERFGFAACNYDGMQVNVDPSELACWATDHDRFYSELLEATDGSPTRCILYERLAERDYLAGILDFLSVRPRDALLKTDSIRQRRDSLRSAIANFDELSRALSGTSLADDLQD
jgi:LPS sulfotransferase NodH